MGASLCHREYVSLAEFPNPFLPIPAHRFDAWVIRASAAFAVSDKIRHVEVLDLRSPPDIRRAIVGGVFVLMQRESTFERRRTVERLADPGDFEVPAVDAGEEASLLTVPPSERWHTAGGGSVRGTCP